MITGIAAPADNRLQRTVMHKVPRHMRQCAAAEPGRYTLLRWFIGLVGAYSGQRR